MAAWMSRAKKAIGATLGAAVAVFITANMDGNVTPDEWGLVASSVVVGAITYYLRNKGKGLNENGSEPRDRV